MQVVGPTGELGLTVSTPTLEAENRPPSRSRTRAASKPRDGLANPWPDWAGRIQDTRDAARMVRAPKSDDFQLKGNLNNTRREAVQFWGVLRTLLLACVLLATGRLVIDKLVTLALAGCGCT